MAGNRDTVGDGHRLQGGLFALFFVLKKGNNIASEHADGKAADKGEKGTQHTSRVMAHWVPSQWEGSVGSVRTESCHGDLGVHWSSIESRMEQTGEL